VPGGRSGADSWAVTAASAATAAIVVSAATAATSAPADAAATPSTYAPRALTLACAAACVAGVVFEEVDGARLG